jgi:glycosyltransferase involved in cell wall biosynthesis
MSASAVEPHLRASVKATEAQGIVVGVTAPGACLLLAGRLRVLRKAGYHVTLVASPSGQLDRTAGQEGVDRIALPIHRKIAPFADLLTLFRLIGILRRIKPVLTEFSTPKAGLLGTLAARLCGVPVRVYMLRGLKLETSSGLKRLMLLAAERLAASCSHVVLCNSESLRAMALELRLASASKLRLLGSGSSNGVDVAHFAPGASDVRSRLGIDAAAPVVGFAGRLTCDKGVPELVEAFDTILKSWPDARLLLVGWFDESEDALGAELQAQIMSHPRIHYTGFVLDTAPYYRAMDLMVLPTWREGFPNVVLEAAATGIPVITTACTGSRDSVLPEVTGLLIPPGYPQAISEAVLKLLADPARCHRMGVAARRWMIEHFVKERVLGLTADYYSSLIEEAMARSDKPKKQTGLSR